MVPSPLSPPAGGHADTHLFGRTRSLLLVALLALLVLCFIFSFITQDATEYLHQLGRATAEKSLVDIGPWQTAQSLASLAVTAEELEYAREAERLADHEVDQAFAAGLRQARLDARHKKLTGEALVLSQRLAQLEQLRQQDQAQVDRLAAKEGIGKSSASAGAPAGSGDLDVARAQLGLDTDEIADTQRELARVSGDHSDQIQEELAAHEASMKQYDSQVASGAPIAVVAVASNHTLASRIAAWLRQRRRQELIDQAAQQAQSDLRSLTAEHNALEAKANAAMASGSGPDRASQLTFLNDRSAEREILSIDDDRIQTEQQLVRVYAKWSAQVSLQHRLVLHLILVSCAVILVILLGMLICDAMVRHWLARPALESRRMRTLRSVLEIGVQVLGLTLILLVLFGAPQETPTILGLATAALTIALQDYIIAFLGWFVLMGKNGIHVGDWVEINGVNGEVVEIRLMTTTLLETGGLVEQGHPTGRRVSFMNGFAIRGQYFNFSTVGQWMWDEITIDAPADADLRSVIENVRTAVLEETREAAQRAGQELKHALRGSALSRFNAEPVVDLRPSGSGAEIHLRYIASAAERLDIRNRIYQRLMELLRGHPAAATRAASEGSGSA